MDPAESPFKSAIEKLATMLVASESSEIYRVIIPGLLSPAFYPPTAIETHHVLQFLHALRGLLQSYPSQLTAMITLPLTLFSRDSALTCFMELLSDGVMELTPFPHSVPVPETSVPGESQEEPPHGMVKMHKLPIFHDTGSGSGVGLDDEYVFTLTRRQFAIKRFSLPPLEGDSQAQQGLKDEDKKKQASMEFWAKSHPYHYMRGSTYEPPQKYAEDKYRNIRLKPGSWSFEWSRKY
jgi:elongator complex protein 4